MIEQRSPEWFEQRKNRITGSIVGAILGLAPYMSRDDAMRSMVRATLGAESEFQGNIATEWGVRNEQNAIDEFEMLFGIDVKPAPFLPYDDWLGASPDGFTSNGGLIEIKCPFGLRKEPEPVAFKSIHDQEHYYAQIQIQLHVTGLSKCHFFQWTPNDYKHELVLYNQEWIDQNIPRLKQFYAEYLDELKNPDDHLAPKRVIIDTPQAHKMIDELDSIKEQMDLLKERQKDLIDDIVNLAGNKNAEFAGRKLTLVKKQGSISYAKALKTIAPDADLEPYRGKETEFWKVG